MTMLIRFVGDAPEQEPAATGRGSRWWPGEVRIVDDAIGRALAAAQEGWEVCRQQDTSGALTAEQVAGVQVLVAGGGNIAPALAHAARRTSIAKRFSDQVGAAYNNSGTAATVSIDATSPFGRPALKVALVSGTTWAEVQLSGLGLAAFDDHIIWRVWVEDYTAIQQIAVYSGTTGYGRYSQQNYQFSTSNVNRYNGEFALTAGPLRQAAVGTFVHGTDTLNDTKIRITGNAVAANVWVDAVVVPARGPGVVLLTYDDGFRSWPNIVLPDLARNGLLASFGFQSNLIGTNDALYLNASDIRAIAAAGHEVAPHQVANTRFNDGISGTQTAAQYHTDYRTCLAALRGIVGASASCDYHPYVQGGHTQSLIDTLRAEGLRIARGVDNQLHNFHSAGLGRGVYSMKTGYMDSSAPDLAALQSAVDAAAKYGTTLVLMGHDFGPSAPGASYWTASLHAQLMDRIGEQVQAGALLSVTAGQYAAAVYSAGLVERQFRLEQAA